MKKILFSVIITSFNSSKYILKTLNSVYKQNFKNFEIILVDDGSSDDTIKIAKKFKKNKKKIKIIELFHKGSPARSRNVGINVSKGKYLCFLDADDIFYKNKLSELFENMLKKNSDVIYHDVYIKHLDKNLISKKIDNRNSFDHLILDGNKIVLSSSVVKKKFLAEKKIKFNEDEKLISVEDYEFWIQIAQNKGIFHSINKVLGVYNLNSSSISKKRYLHFINTFFLLKKYEKFFQKKKRSFF